MADRANTRYFETFDAVLTGSVLVFCDPRRLGDAPRPEAGGYFGSNEMTLSRPLPAGAEEELAELLETDIRFLNESEWRHVFENAGFVDVRSTVGRIVLQVRAIRR
jgi:hypothetical protein